MVSWGGKMTTAQSSTIALSVKRLKEYSFALFHHVFWKRTIFEGVPVAGFLGFLVSKVHWGVNKMRKKKFFKGKPIWAFPFALKEAYSFKSASSARLFLNSATRWRSSTPESCNTLLISTQTKVLKTCISKIYMLKVILIRFEFNRYANRWFSKQYTIHQNAFSSFMIQGSQNLTSDGLSFMRSRYSQASCGILHREKKSQIFIRYCLRKVYWKILHCRLWRISRNTLTHVYGYTDICELTFLYLFWSSAFWNVDC